MQLYKNIEKLKTCFEANCTFEINQNSKRIVSFCLFLCNLMDINIQQ